MKTKTILILSMLVLPGNLTRDDLKTRPPLAKTNPVTDEYFGTKITDPYRYMENLRDTSVLNWIKVQADYSRKILDGIPGRQKLIDKMMDFEKRKSTRIGLLNITDNDHYFYLKITPSDETGKLFYRIGFDGQESLLFDPEKYDPDTTKKYVVSSFYPSSDGSKVALAVSPNGSENAVLLIINVKEMKLYPERVGPVFGSVPVSWASDNNSVLYLKVQSSDVHNVDRMKNNKTFLHVVGTDPATDREIFSGSLNPELNITPDEMPILQYDRESHLLLGMLATVDNRINMYYAPESELGKPKIAWKRLFKPEDEVYNYATTATDIYIYTPKGAPNFKIMKVPLRDPDMTKAEVVVPEDPDRKLSAFTLTSDGLFYVLTENGVRERLFRLTKGAKSGQEINLPFTAGAVRLTSKGPRFTDIWVGLSGWTSEGKRFRYLTNNDSFKSEKLTLPADFPEFNNLVVEELMVPSHDGVLVPLSLIYNKDLKKTGKNMVLIYGYGAYGMSNPAAFSPPRLLWTLENGILAIAHVRGGGELGDKWYKGGFKTTKPNTWKDLIACAEYMIKEGYSSPGKIAIQGGSAGGILIGRAMTERPDLFAAAIPMVGVLNPVRFEESPNGAGNVPEFGTVKDPVECKALIEMDAYLHIKDGVKYPATLITAGMNDPRVIVWQPAKFAARLEAANASDKPILFLTDYKAGHGVGNTKTKSIENVADVYSFALWQEGHPDFQPK